MTNRWRREDSLSVIEDSLRLGRKVTPAVFPVPPILINVWCA